MRSHNSVRQETNENRIAAINEAVPLTTERAVINSSVLMIKALCAQMKTTIESIREFAQEISALRPVTLRLSPVCFVTWCRRSLCVTSDSSDGH